MAAQSTFERIHGAYSRRTSEEEPHGLCSETFFSELIPEPRLRGHVQERAAPHFVPRAWDRSPADDKQSCLIHAEFRSIDVRWPGRGAIRPAARCNTRDSVSFLALC